MPPTPPFGRSPQQVSSESIGLRLESKGNSGTLDKLFVCVSPPSRLSHLPRATPVAFRLLPCLSPTLAALSRKSLASRMSSSYAGWPQGSVGWRRARERTRAATQRTSASAQAARLSSAGPQWSAIDGRPLRARTSLSLRGRLWTLTYVYGKVFARLGGVCARSGRCGGGVGGVGGTSAMHVCDARLYALSVCMCDCTS